MGKFRFTLTNIIFWIAILFSWYMVENIGLLTENIFRGFDPITFVLLLIATIGIYAVYYFLEHKKNGMKLDYILLPALIVIFIIMTWTIWYQLDSTWITNISTGYKAHVTFTHFEKFEYTCELAISLLALYTVLFVYGRGRVRVKGMSWIPNIYIIYTVISCILSWFMDADVYKTLFTKGEFIHGVEFWYYNENLFGFALLVGVLCCFIANYHKKRWWVYVCIIWFYITTIATNCGTSIAVLTIAIPLYLLMEIIFSFKNHKVRSLVLLIAFVSSIVIGGVSVFLIVKHPVGPFVKISNILNENLFNKDFSTLSRRKIVWHDAFDLISDSTIHLIFGRGYRTSTELLRGYTAAMNNGDYVSSAHSAYFEILLRSGLFGLILYALGIGYYLYACIRLLIKKQARFVLIHLFCTISILFQGVTESNTLFTSNVTGIVETLLFIMPVIWTHKHTIHPQIAEDSKTLEVKKPSLNLKLVSRLTSVVITALCIGTLTAFATGQLYKDSNILRIVIMVFLMLFILLLTVPYLLTVWGRNVSTKRFVARTTVYILLTMLITVGIMIYYIVNSGISLQTIFATCFTELVLFATLLAGYSHLGNDSAKEWFSETIHGAFITPVFGIACSGVGIIVAIVLGLTLPLNYHSMMIIVSINILIYLAGFAFIPRQETKEIVNYFNDANMSRMKELTNSQII